MTTKEEWAEQHARDGLEIARTMAREEALISRDDTDWQNEALRWKGYADHFYDENCRLHAALEEIAHLKPDERPSANARLERLYTALEMGKTATPAHRRTALVDVSDLEWLLGHALRQHVALETLLDRARTAAVMPYEKRMEDTYEEAWRQYMLAENQALDTINAFYVARDLREDGDGPTPFTHWRIR